MSLENIINSIPTEEEVNELANLFKILGDPTRTKILYCLAEKELNVTDITKCLNMTKSAISHQLRVLRQAKLVKAKKEGKEVFYSLDDEHVNLIFNCALAHVRE